MPDIKYVGTSVNSAIQDLTSLTNRFQPVSTAVQTKTGVMIGCKGFNTIAAGDVSTGVFSGVINSCEQNISNLVGAVRKSQCEILSFSQNQTDIDDFADSLSTSEYYALKDAGLLQGFDKKISVLTKAGFFCDNCFATACAFVGGFAEGALDFVENIGDGVVMLAGSAVSGVCDLVGAEDAANAVNDWTRATVSVDVVGNAFDSFYANTPAGQWIQNNSTVFDEARGIGEGVGYAGAVIAATAAVNVLCPGVGTAVLMPAIAAASGFGNAAERSTADGATLGDALVYSTASAAWEGAQWAIGSQINKLGGETLIAAATRIALDAADSGLEGFVQPTLNMLYKDYGEGSFAANWTAAFNANGGFDTVIRQATVGAIMSTIGEATNMFRSRSSKKLDVDGGSKPDVDGGTKPDSDVNAKAAGDENGLSVVESKPDADVNGGKPDVDGGSKPDVDGNGTKSFRQRLSDAGDSILDSAKHPIKTLGDTLSNGSPSRIAQTYTESIQESGGHNITDFYPTAETQSEFRLELDPPTGEDLSDIVQPSVDSPTGSPTGSPTSPVTVTPTNPTTTTPTDPVITTPTDPITTPTDPIVTPTDPITTPTDPITTPTDPTGPSGSGHSGSGFGGDGEFNGAAFSLDGDYDDGFDSIADIIANGSKFGTIPSSISPLKASGSGGSAFVPIAAGLSAAAAVGLGTKAYLDKKNANDDEDDDDTDLEDWVFDDETDNEIDDDEYSFIPEELLED